MDTSNNSSSLRVLIRPSPSTNTTIATNSTISSDIPTSFTSSPLPLPTNSSSTDGVVVVGFIGKKEEDLSQLINRIVDYNVFGSGNLGLKFPIHNREEEEKVKNWFHSRSISYYYDEERGIVFLRFVSNICPEDEFPESSMGLDSGFEQHQYEDLQGMLLMFSVCHVIIYLQEGSRFHTQTLKTLRLLQAAKHAPVPFMKSQFKPTLSSRVSSSSSTSHTTMFSPNPRNDSSHGRMSLMSGLGSYSSFFPGQCTPVVLFVFLDDFPEGPNNTGYIVEDSAEASMSNPSLNLGGLPRPNLPVKSSTSVVMLSRPMSKPEGTFRKKLQSSLEAQIRFLIKKCRILSGSEGNHAGSRGGGNPSSTPLFSLEASRAVALLDRFTNQRGESLNFATALVEEVLNVKLASDSLLLESHYQATVKEDIQCIKEFIYKQSDTLRGRGGLVSNSSSGSASGAGMVAVAAAAAAASAASGKPATTPVLPSLENWLSSSQLILEALISVRCGIPDESESIQIIKSKPVLRNGGSTQVERIPPARTGIDPVQSAISLLESGKGLNIKFSTSWCQRALPAAKELYLKDLPACYPTSVHEVHLNKALHAFHSKVMGPAVHIYAKKLRDECMTIWSSGRQLCDAISLTGRPCMHQRHNIETDGKLAETSVKPHSSGFVFLHACACGRSRRPRDDPFDFETANVTFNSFPNCHNLLPALQLPQLSDTGPIKPSSWSLIRVGGSRYYEPSKGLIQSGFCSTEKFLLKWTIMLEKPLKASNSAEEAVRGGPIEDPKLKSVVDEGTKQVGDVENQRSEKISSLDKKIGSDRGIPRFNMRRPFSEVVAGSVATDAAFPPLQQRKQPTTSSEKSVKQRVPRNRGEENAQVTGEHQGSQVSEGLPSFSDISGRVGASGYPDGEPSLQIGSNVVPISMVGGGMIKPSTTSKHANVYFGFEHECPQGHRFLLTSKHLNELGSFYSLAEESRTQSVDGSERKSESSNSKKFAHDKAHSHASASMHKVRTSSRSNQRAANGSQHLDRVVLFSEPGKEHSKFSVGKTHSESVEDLEERPEFSTIDDGVQPFSLLNRNIPIYMNCPHCRTSKSKKGHHINFESTVSQLQRIFLVTPPFPVVLATCPSVQFEASCLAATVPDSERQLQFSIGCRIILPPESFLTLRLPFVYGVQLENGRLHPFHHLENQPELTAWISGSTILQIMSKGSSTDEEV
ncbi:uncharacterized protein LOC113298696 isoform X1 [Papaver somniferum]|uniref:uncharacterized protein LOC113298696 isoform X1 n=1 Tax=Papaver somniferum TaxID=3469 RepID=UPI000E704489|nr:uncharacterized protein LOC113298696 isoform X1 [Papaver somniferum]